MSTFSWSHNDLYEFLRDMYRDAKMLVQEPTFLDVKTSNDFVTSVDFAIEEAVIGFIRRYEPTALVLSEENSWVEAPERGDYWILDPLDGTGNFVNRIPVYGISIAKVVRSEVVLAGVIDLVRGEIFSALKGKGFRLNNQLAGGAAAQQTKLAIVSTGYLKSFGAAGLISNGYKLRNFGSQALHLGYVAAGRVDLCFSEEARIWDDIAGSLLVSESGGEYNNAFPGVCFLKLGREQMELNSVASSSASADFVVQALHTDPSV